MERSRGEMKFGEGLKEIFKTSSVVMHVHTFSGVGDILCGKYTMIFYGWWLFSITYMKRWQSEINNRFVKCLLSSTFMLTSRSMNVADRWFCLDGNPEIFLNPLV